MTKEPSAKDAEASTEKTPPKAPSKKATGKKSSLAEFTPRETRALGVLTVIALIGGAYFLKDYLELIAMAAVLAYLFLPLYRRFTRKFNAGISSALTVLSAIAIVVIPLSVIFTMAGVQINEMVKEVSKWLGKTDMTELGKRVLTGINDVLNKIPFVKTQVTPDDLQEGAGKLASSIGRFALEFAQGSVGGIASGITLAIIFVYVFVGLLGNGGKVVETIKDLNPLSPEVSDVYLSKIGAMVTATVRGQFVIAFVQGTAGAISIWIGGIHQGFFMFVIFLTVLSIIPLGSGVVTIPLGIGMALTGNIAGGVFVVLFHFLITTNIDNVLRPMLVPRSAYLHPALMMVAVFAGLKTFGFAGIVFGPVLMIVIVTTINLYRAVHKGTAWEEDFTDDKGVQDEQKPSLWSRLVAKFRKNPAPAATTD